MRRDMKDFDRGFESSPGTKYSHKLLLKLNNSEYCAGVLTMMQTKNSQMFHSRLFVRESITLVNVCLLTKSITIDIHE